MPLILVGAIGLEPTTPTMSRWCSNQLSYAPEETEFYLKQDNGSNYNGGFGNNISNRLDQLTARWHKWSRDPGSSWKKSGFPNSWRSKDYVPVEKRIIISI